MQNSKSKYTFLKNIAFSQLKLWDVKGYLRNTLSKKEGYIQLKDVIKPVRKSVSKEEVILNKWRIISKINFGGQLFLRDFEEIHTYKGNLLLVPKNAIIFSKINARHGCIYFHDNDIPFCVSSEYPAFLIDTNRVNGAYLQMMLRSNKVKEHLNAKVTGISKARVKANEFVEISFPLPSLTEQNNIVSEFQRKIQLAKEHELRATEISREIENYLFSNLGVVKKTAQKSSKNSLLSFISFKEIERWAISYINKNQKFSFKSVKYEVKPIKQLIRHFDGGKTPSTSRKEFWDGDVNWFSAKDMKDLFLKESEDKITTFAVENAGMKIHPVGTILGVFRSGILRHSFPVAILEKPASINQDLKAISFNNSLVENEYMLYYLNTFQELILEQAQKTGVTVESINTDEFLEIPVVVPDLAIQTVIIKHISEMKTQIKQLKQQAEQNRILTLQEFENELFN